MQVIVRPRQGGKTTDLIKRAAQHFAYIVVPDHAQARLVWDMAKLMGADIPYPITWVEFVEARYHSRGVQAFAIDNLDACLAQMTTVPIVATTMTGTPTDGTD